jgi:hypothetical protein
MAGTEHDPNTSEWWLLRSELGFVAEHCSEPVAKELLLDWLDRRRVRHRCEKIEFDGHAGGANRFFWRCESHSRITVDWENSSATRVGPPFVVRRDVEEDTWPFFLLDQPIISLKMRLIWLHHGDVVAMLRVVRLLPPDVSAAPAAEAAQRETCASWVAKAVKLHPRQPDWTGSRWAQALAGHAPGGVEEGWDWRTILNELSNQDFIKNPVSQKASQKSHKK